MSNEKEGISTTTPPASDDTSEAQPTVGSRKMRPTVIGAMFASGLEWYDFGVYSVMAALVFGELFFPSLDPTAGTLASFATFAAGFVVRPLGGILGGMIGDRYGRKVALLYSVGLIGVATLLIGLLPTYAVIGVWAPILLVTLRLLQGLAVGAQWGGASLLLVESSPVNRRGFYGGLMQSGSMVGNLLGLSMTLILAMADPEQFNVWGWRVPFVVGILTVFMAVYIQRKVEETESFQRMAAASKARRTLALPLVKAFRKYPLQILQAGLCLFVANGTFYIFLTGIVSYGTQTLGFGRDSILLAVILAGTTQLVTCPLFGRLSDRRSRKNQYVLGTILMMVFAFPFFWMVDTGSFPLLVVALVIGFTLHAFMYGPLPAMYAELFGADVRNTGAAMGYQLAALGSGAVAPFIMTALLAATQTSASISLYMIALGVVSLIGALSIKEHFQRDLGEI